MEANELEHKIKTIKNGIDCIFKLCTVYGNFYMDSKCLIGEYSSNPIVIRDGDYYLSMRETCPSTREESTLMRPEEILPKFIPMGDIKSFTAPITDETELKKIELLLEGENATLVRSDKEKPFKTYPRIISPNIKIGDIMRMNGKSYKVIGKDTNNKTVTAVQVNKVSMLTFGLAFSTIVYMRENDAQKITIPFSELTDLLRISFEYRTQSIASVASQIQHREIQRRMAMWMFKTALNHNKNK